MHKILLIDDDREISGLIRSVLVPDYEVDCAYNGDSGMDTVAKKKYDLILLDVMMPGKDGYEVLGLLKRDGRFQNIPVIMLTHVSEAIAPTLGFGAADFIAKPFEEEEIRARIRAVLKRNRPLDIQPAERAKKKPPMYIDDKSHEVYVNGGKIDLSPTEYKLLALLMENTGRVLSRQQIIDGLQTSNVTDRTIDSHITHLRKKLGSQSKQLETIRSFGYKLTSD